MVTATDAVAAAKDIVYWTDVKLSATVLTVGLCACVGLALGACQVDVVPRAEGQERDGGARRQHADQADRQAARVACGQGEACRAAGMTDHVAEISARVEKHELTNVSPEAVIQVAKEGGALENKPPEAS